MRALSIKQPWASLICTPREDNPLLGIKDIENRTWKTSYRGKVLIHASGKVPNSYFNIPTQLLYKSNLQKYQGEGILHLKDVLINQSVYGAIIGEVDIIDCVINHPSIWAEKTEVIGKTIDGEYLYRNKPIYNWVLANPVFYDKPILNVKGKLSFWEFNKE